MDEIERALRAATCDFCKREVSFKNILKVGHVEDGIYELCTSKHAELLPLFNAGMERAYRDKETSVVQHMKGGWPDGCMCDPCVTVREAVNQSVAGAYAAAAKAVHTVIAEAATQDEAERQWELKDRIATDILALTPADARQASQQIERMACGHLKADWIPTRIAVLDIGTALEKLHAVDAAKEAVKANPGYCRTCAAITSAVQENEAQINRHVKVWANCGCVVCEAIKRERASAEARARLEEAKWWRYLVRMHEESYFAREGDIRIRELEAAARTPDSTKERQS